MSPGNRRTFLGTALAAGLGGGMEEARRWAVLTIGNLSRNRYWGESDQKPYRSAICTCTLIAGDRLVLLVDPSLKDAGEMARELDRRTGLKAEDIRAVFVTHEHGDHWAGIEHFPRAEWFAAPAVAGELNRGSKCSRPIKPAGEALLPFARVVATPGHTVSHHSLVFSCGKKRIAVAGDAVATADFWRERRSYFNAVDPKEAARSMDRLARLADIVIPGHDNYFAVR